MSNNNVIPAEALGQWQSWHFGELGAAAPASETAEAAAVPAKPEPPAEGVSALEPPPAEPEAVADEAAADAALAAAYPTAAELEAIHQQAWQAGFEAGHQEGVQQGRGEGAQQALAEAAARFDEYWSPLAALQQAFDGEVQQLGAALSAEVLQLALDMAERIVACRIELDAQALLPVLQQALDEVGDGLRQVKVRAHPEDVAVIEAFAGERFPGGGWQWQADAAMARGGCLLDAGGRKVDLSLPARLAALRQALGAGND